MDIINKTVPYFENAGVDAPRLTIELLLAHVLKKKRLQLYLEFERDVDPATLEILRGLVKRRVAGEPVQYVTGEAEFCGLKLAVDRRVLIPRPETELLVEVVVARQPATVVDVGTGSGCIALALAQRLPAAEVTATDISPAALDLARANAARYALKNFTRFLPGDLLSVLPDSCLVDAIVSNPPYIASGDWAQLPREVKDFEPEQALLAGVDGLEVIGRLVLDARRYLSPTGFVALEIGAGQRAAVAELLERAGYTVAQVEKDLQGHERVIVAVVRT